MAGPYDVIDCGNDTSGRTIWMNRRMKAALEVAFQRFDSKPLVTQGAYMSRVPGGGAPGSAGYHDEGACLDFRVWDLASRGLTPGKVVRALRWVGWAAWLRDPTHGGFTDPHIHAVLLGDHDAAWGALDQMSQYHAGLDGLASRGRDYHPRPSPIPTFDYARWKANVVTPEDRQWLAAKISDDGDKTRALVVRTNEGDARRNEKVLTAIDALPDTITKRDLRVALKKVLEEQAEEPPA